MAPTWAGPGLFSQPGHSTVSVPATTIASPDVFAVQFDFVSEVVIDGDGCPRSRIYPVHVALEVLPVSISVVPVFGHEQVRVNHLMQQGVNEVTAGSELQQGFTEADGADGVGSVLTHTRTTKRQQVY